MSEAGERDRLFVFGCGFSASRVVERVRKRVCICGVTVRSEERVEALAESGHQAYRFAGETVDAGIAPALEDTSLLLVSVPPDASGDPVLQAFATTILEKMPNLTWIGYLSTVGVYGDHGGAWVDEETPPHPVSRRSVERLHAEEAWQKLAQRRGVPLAILRLSGIYGPGRNAFVNLANGTARRLVKAGQVFNRIHVEDIAGAVDFLSRQRLGGVFNVTDDEPAPPQDVVEWAARLAGVEPPPEIDFETAELSPMARSFYGEIKRVSNARLKAAGYAFAYPTYREGLAALAGDFVQP
ncbi:SDR family oxidoreductase [Consotaella salsifontis]|uniref:Nucleoside-diphosphate-sugar epimerase n=1 Tax=Consotaella salsifontis TaxID=1365950 RepID=A0A1T4QWD6_9HYPH|nr:SDR family oxidoreductase [Consotaella salsifontis]SKA07966.1 Nucleoside-diphosphate-sugar epimerase [Consotaella salsifontis]